MQKHCKNIRQHQRDQTWKELGGCRRSNPKRGRSHSAKLWSFSCRKSFIFWTSHGLATCSNIVDLGIPMAPSIDQNLSESLRIPKFRHVFCDPSSCFHLFPISQPLGMHQVQGSVWCWAEPPWTQRNSQNLVLWRWTSALVDSPISIGSVDLVLDFWELLEPSKSKSQLPSAGLLQNPHWEFGPVLTLVDTNQFLGKVWILTPWFYERLNLAPQLAFQELPWGDVASLQPSKQWVSTHQHWSLIIQKSGCNRVYI